MPECISPSLSKVLVSYVQLLKTMGNPKRQRAAVGRPYVWKQASFSFAIIQERDSGGYWRISMTKPAPISEPLIHLLVIPCTTMQ